MRRRVVVTGMAGLCPLGQSWAEVGEGLKAGTSGVSVVPEWEKYVGLRTRLAAAVPAFAVPPHYTRKKVRTMGRVSLLATRATELALEDAGLLGSAEITSGTMGIAYGSTAGSPPAMEIYARMFQ
jgi:3-oxoacyl-[acyl-carrier-protein] synthase II